MRGFSKHFRIGGKWVGDGEPCFITAELGLNHNGDVKLAKRLIETAKDCNVDAVKFQKRDIDSVLTERGFNRPYVSWYSYGETYGEHRKALELSEDDYRELRVYADKIGVIFCASVWDTKSADFLETLDVPAYKIPSADVTNLPLIEHVAEKGKPVILSTGMSTMEEISEAVRTISHNTEELILLQCVSTYPSSPLQMNLRAMGTLRKKFNCLAGYSGHASSIVFGPVAVALGACMVEKHFTLDRTMKGPDHAASLEPTGLFKLVRDIREVEAAIGDGEKKILEEELEIRKKLGKSVVASCDIKKGEIVTSDMLAMKSPALGVDGRKFSWFIGKTATRDIPKDEYLSFEDVEGTYEQD